MDDLLKSASDGIKKRFKNKPPFWVDFWDRVENYGQEGCWEWKHRRNTRGYGTLKVMNKSVLAHRYAWELTNGKIENGACACHKCDNRSCCNPSHLFIGSREDNNRDKMQKGRHISLSGEAHPRAKFTEMEIREMRSLFDSGVAYRKIAIRYNIPPQTVYSIVSRETWKNVV